MSEAILGALIAAGGALLAAVLAILWSVRVRRDAAREKRHDRLEHERRALQAVVDMTYDIPFLTNPSIKEDPAHTYDRVGRLRDTVLQAQGALPPAHRSRPTLANMLATSGKLRSDYRALERPIGQPQAVKVAFEDFEPSIDDFQASFGPLLNEVEEFIAGVGEDGG